MRKLLIFLVIFPNLGLAQSEPSAYESILRGLTQFQRFSHYGLKPAREYIYQSLRQMGFSDVRTQRFAIGKNYLHRRAHGINYVVEIQGSKRPHEIVTVTAHYDTTGKKVVGANDNGSGAAAVLTLAQLFKEQAIKPDRTIRLILFDGEEVGYHGSIHHYLDSAQKGEDIKLAINMDMIAYPGIDHRTFVFDARNYHPNLRKLVEHASLIMEDDAKMIPVMGARLYRSDHVVSDHFHFPSVGIAERFLNEDFVAETISPNYHTPDDTIEKLNLDYAYRIALYAGTLAQLAANSVESWGLENDPANRLIKCAQYLESRKRN